mgnify:CR=1 FL=1
MIRISRKDFLKMGVAMPLALQSMSQRAEAKGRTKTPPKRIKRKPLN